MCGPCMSQNVEKIAHLRQQIHDGIERVRRSIEAARFILLGQEPPTEWEVDRQNEERSNPRKSA